MFETKKCYNIRKNRGDFEKFLNGKGIDIGGGPDCLKIPHGTVQLWDLKDGDARFMRGVEDNTYDFVYSSHCLEHVTHVDQTLENWIRILKPGGHLYIVVPDYQLYEKCIWPPIFNQDHKFTFSLNHTRDQVRRMNHYNIQDNLIPILNKLNCEVLFVKLEDDNYDYNRGGNDQTMENALAQICIIARKKII